MGIISKLRKIFDKSIKVDIIKTMYCRFKLNLPRNVIFHVFPKSIVKIANNARVNISKGEIFINASWTKGRKRRNISELILCSNSNLIIDGNFALYQGASVYVGENATLKIKGNSFLNTNSVLNCFHYIEIGEGTMISDDVRIQDSDNHIVIENGVEKESTKPIIIGNRVWIGKNVMILKGVTVGDGAIIAAGSVVVKDIPAGCLAAGNPAKVIKQNIEWK